MLDDGCCMLQVLHDLNQLVDKESMRLALQFCHAADNPYFRLCYNSLGAYGTVNHLHFQVGPRLHNLLQAADVTRGVINLVCLHFPAASAPALWGTPASQAAALPLCCLLPACTALRCTCPHWNRGRAKVPGLTQSICASHAESAQVSLCKDLQKAYTSAQVLNHNSSTASLGTAFSSRVCKTCCPP